MYKVAYRTALEARARANKIAAREKSGGEALAVQPAADPLWNDLRPILDEEVNRLPERLRRPFVLCYLEGKTNDEAARELGCRPGTIYSRLSRGRDMLRRRLSRRGVMLPAAALMTALGQRAAEAVPTASLLATTTRAALLFAGGRAVGDSIPIQVTALAEGVLRTMFVTKIKMAALVLFVVGLLAAGGAVTRQALTAAPQPEPPKQALPVPPEVARKDESKKTVVQVVRPTPGGLERTSQYTGHVRAATQQQVYPAVSGYLKRQLVDIGDRVKKGDLLAEIDAPLLLVEARQAEATVALARGQVREAEGRVATAAAEVKAATDRVKAFEGKVKSSKANLAFRTKQAERYKELLKERSIDARLVDEQEDRREAAQEELGSAEVALTSARSDVAVTESKVESARAALESAKANVMMVRFALDKARLQVESTQIRSNFDGVVTRRNFDDGNFFSANNAGSGRPLLIVQRTDSVRVVAEVAENEIPFVRPGVPVDLQIGALPDVQLPACKVSRIGFALDEKSSTMPVEIDVPNPKDLLRPGMFLHVTLHLAKPSPNAVTVPSSCLLCDPPRQHDFVYVIRDGKAHLTPVRVGTRSGGKSEILSGVQAKDRVVVDPRGLEGEIVPVEIKKAP